MKLSNNPRYDWIAIIGAFGILILSFGSGAHWGWPVGVMVLGAFLIFISWAAN